MLPRPASSRKAKPQLTSIVSTAQRSLGIAVNGSSTPSPSTGSASAESRSSILGNLPNFRLGLPSPTTTAFIISCLLWYLSSALSSNTSKALLSSPKHIQPRPLPPFPYPVTLTMVQFFFVHILSASVASPSIMRHIPGVRKPVTRIQRNVSWAKLSDMAKLSVFNVVGHAMSTIAISRVPVSTVHTIKALTPLFTVLSFHFLFHIDYSFMTYFSLLPLTLGVMMACTSLSFSANDLVGLFSALASTLIFVAQSIYSKNLIGRGEGTTNKQDKDGKLDKINILYYSSACSVVIMIPMALYYDGTALLLASHPTGSPLVVSSIGGSSVAAGSTSASVAYIVAMLTANGIVQFFQNFLAFSVLALVSPVTYSVASLFKRVFVICFAIVWFGQSVSGLQWLGIVLTFIGLYMYNGSKATKSIHRGEEKLREEEVNRSMSLPTTNSRSVPIAAATTTSSVPSVLGSAIETYNRLWKSGSSNTSAAINTRPTTTAAAGFRDMSEVGSPTSNTRRLPHGRILHSDVVNVAIDPKDPRATLPSPPPSRGPSSDDEDPLSRSYEPTLSRR